MAEATVHTEKSVLRTPSKLSPRMLIAAGAVTVAAAGGLAVGLVLALRGESSAPANLLPSPPSLPAPPGPPPAPPAAPVCQVHAAAHPCIATDPALVALRRASLRCLLRFSNATSDFGSKDSNSWEEYGPREVCLTGGGETGGTVQLTASEPKNAISSLSFDSAACDCTPRQRLVAESASHLGFGSFAMHASGGHSVTTKLDTVPMSCFALNLMEQVMNLTNSSYLVTVGTTTYDIAALSANCVPTLSAALRTCDMGVGPNPPPCTTNACPLLASLNSMSSSLPNFRLVFSMLAYSLLNKCFGRAAAAASLNTVASAFGLSTSALTDLSNMALGGGLGFPDATVCTTLVTALLTFAEGASLQGTLGGGQERHDLWHEKTALAARYLLQAMQRF